MDNALPRRNGFTLLEVLLAVSITAVLGVALVALIAGAEDTSARGRAVMRAQRGTRVTTSLLGMAIREMTPLTLSQAEVALHILKREGLEDLDELKSGSGIGRIANPPRWFRGDETRFGFTLNRPFFHADPDGYMHWITLEEVTEEKSGAVRLVLTDYPFLRGVIHPETREDTDPLSDSTVLEDSIASVRFAYEWPRTQGEAQSALRTMAGASVDTEWTYDERMVRMQLPVSVTMTITYPADSGKSPAAIRYPFEVLHKPWLPNKD